MISELICKSGIWTNSGKDMSLTQTLKVARDFVRLHAGEKVTFDLSLWKRKGQNGLIANYVDLAWGFNRYPEKIPNMIDLIRDLKQQMPKVRCSIVGYIWKIVELDKNIH